MPKIIKLDFKKTSDIIDTTAYAHVDLLDSENLTKIEKYILPIIAENAGWGTEEVTFDGFKKDPIQYQDALDATLFANVHITLDEKGKPAGLLEYLEETLANPISRIRMQNIDEMVSSKEKWQDLIKLEVIDERLVNKFFPILKSYISEKKFYSEIGVVVRPDLQGKKTGIAQELYSLLSNGILLGWTSNPLVIAQWRKYFGKVLFFPLMKEKLEDLEDLASLVILYADLLTYSSDRLEGLEFGVINSPYFVSERDNYYLELARTLASNGKITKLDEERIKYCIEKTSVQGAIVAFSN